MTWHWYFNLDSAPKGYAETEKRPDGKDGFRFVEVYRYAPVILATKCGKVVKSRWLPPSEKEKRPVGRWEFLAAGEEPEAWQPWPTHPRVA